MIYINASELALWTGKNPYENRALNTLRFWRRYFPENYEKAKREYVEKTGNEPHEYWSTKEKESNIEKKIKTTFRKRLHTDIQDSQSAEEAMQKKAKLVQEIVQESQEKGIVLNAEEVEQVKQSVEKNLKTGFGTQKEHTALDWYEQTYPENGKLKRNVSLFQKLFFQVDQKNSETLQIYLQGKYDGMTEDGSKIIEIKHRMNGCFRKIRDYEQVQVDAYHMLFQVETVELVECFKKKDGKHEYCRLISHQSNERWEEIKERLVEWIQVLVQLITPGERLRQQVFDFYEHEDCLHDLFFK